MVTQPKIYGHTKRKWTALVDRGQKVSAQDQELRWTIAELLLDVAPVAFYPTGVHTDFTVKDALRTFARDSGLDMTVGAMCEHRMQAINWPRSQRCPGAAWSAHRALSAHPERFELIKPGMTHKQATILAGRVYTEPKSKKETATPEEIRDLIAWANRLLRKAEVLTYNSVLDYQERSHQHEILDTTEARVERLRRATLEAEDLHGKRKVA